MPTAAPKSFARGERKRLLVHHTLSQFCADLHVHYQGSEEPYHLQRGDDDLHLTPQGHADKAREEADALIAAWRAARGGS